MSIFLLLCQIYLFVDCFEVKAIRIFSFSFEYLQLFSLLRYHIIRYFDKNQNLLLLFMGNDLILASFCYSFHGIMEIALHLILISLFKSHNEVPILDDLFRASREPFFDDIFIALPDWFFLWHITRLISFILL